MTQAAGRQIAEAWLRDAFMEHASVASFARFALELLSLGAPLDLVEGAQAAMADELRHTRVCFEMAARYGAGNIEPGALDVGHATAHVSLAQAIESTIREGCVGETIAALLASRAAEAATDPLARATLETIAHDETRHAALAWRFVGWAIRRGGDAAREAVIDAFELAKADVYGELMAAEPSLDEGLARELSSHGRLPAQARAAIAREALDQVVLPCMRAMLS